LFVVVGVDGELVDVVLCFLCGVGGGVGLGGGGVSGLGVLVELDLGCVVGFGGDLYLGL